MKYEINYQIKGNWYYETLKNAKQQYSIILKEISKNRHYYIEIIKLNETEIIIGQIKENGKIVAKIIDGINKH